MNIFSAWFRFKRAKLPISGPRLFSMVLLRSLSKELVDAMILNHLEQLGADEAMLESHCLASGNPYKVVSALKLAADQALPVDAMAVMAADLMGRDLDQFVCDYAAIARAEPGLTAPAVMQRLGMAN